MSAARAVESITAATTRDEATEAIADLLGDSGAMDDLKQLAEDDPGAWAATLARLGAVKGIHASVRRLEKLITSRRVTLRVVGDDEPGGFPDCVPEGYTVPAGWIVTQHGVFHRGQEAPERVTTSPIYVVGRMVDVDSGAHALELAWPAWGRGWQTHVVPAGIAADARGLVSLAAAGAPINSQNSKRVVEYLDRSRDANKGALPLGLTAQRMGWMEGGFLLGERWIGSDRPVLWRGDEGQAQIAEAYKTRGTWEGWLSVFGELGSCSAAWLAVYAPIASVLLDYCGVTDGQAIDWSSETTGGKTTILRLGASTMGAPNKLIRPWKTSMAGLEAYCSTLRHLAPMLDDTKKARKRDMVADMLYMQSGGMGQTRGRPGGAGQGVALRRTETWCSLALSTGEERATSFTQDAGARARTLCLVGDPLESRDQADRIAAITSDHHGHLMPRVLRHLLEGGTRADLTKRYQEARVHYGAKLAEHSAVAGRLGDVIAMLAVASEVCEAVGVPAPGHDPLALAWSCAIEGGKDADRPTEALRALWEWTAVRQHEFFGRGENDKRAPPSGWAGVWREGDLWSEVAYTTRAVEKALEDAGYQRDHVSGILERWHERGWLQTSKGRRKANRRINGAQVRCYVFERETLEEVGCFGVKE